MRRFVLSLVVFGVGLSVAACSSPVGSAAGGSAGGTSQPAGGAGSVAGNTGFGGASNPGGAGVPGVPGGGATQFPGGGAPGLGGAGTLPGGGASSGTAGGTAMGGAGAPTVLCSTGAVSVGSGRCATMKTIATGSAIMIHDFEDPGSDPPLDYLGIFFGDGRSGRWFDSHDTVGAATVSMLAEPATGGPSGNTHALHYHGGAPKGFGATVGIPVAACYDASVYKGISFYIKGDPAAGNTQVKFSVATPPTEPVASGGGCSMADELAGKCYDHYAQTETITSDWVRHNIHWADLKQNCSSGNGYKPQSEILNFSFSILDPTKGFDFWVDNFSFDTGDLPDNGFADIVPEAAFNEMWQTRAAGKVIDQRAAFYTYAGLLAAISSYGKGTFATTGTADQRRREAAMFLSNIGHETDSLALVEEKACAGNNSCTQYGVASDGHTYDGRGAIQISYATNYTAAGAALGADLTNHPELVATDPKLAFGTAVWFWMNGTSGMGTTAHDAVPNGLGATIRVINSIECNNGNAPAVADRIRLYHRFCDMLGVEPGTGDGC
jgi:predicted chitinase